MIVDIIIPHTDNLETLDLLDEFELPNEQQYEQQLESDDNNTTI